MSVAIVTLLALAILIVGFLVGWLVGGIGAGLSGIAFLGLPVLVIGFLIGWLVEWIIDNQYRRMRELGQGTAAPVAQAVPSTAPSGPEITELTNTIRQVLSERQEEIDHLESQIEGQESRFEQIRAEFDHYMSTHPDDLTAIKGIGRIYQWKLRDAGISTYAQLAATTPEDLREMLQIEPWQKFEPQGWIDQAKVLGKRE